MQSSLKFHSSKENCKAVSLICNTKVFLAFHAVNCCFRCPTSIRAWPSLVLAWSQHLIILQQTRQVIVPSPLDVFSHFLSHPLQVNDVILFLCISILLYIAPILNNIGIICHQLGGFYDRPKIQFHWFLFFSYIGLFCQHHPRTGFNHLQQQGTTLMVWWPPAEVQMLCSTLSLSFELWKEDKKYLSKQGTLDYHLKKSNFSPHTLSCFSSWAKFLEGVFSLFEVSHTGLYRVLLKKC